MPGFKGYIHDVGGPTANFRFPACKKQEKFGCCKDKRCLFPTTCQNIEADHTDYLELLRELRHIEGVKKVFVRSGLRYDYMMAEKVYEQFRERYARINEKLGRKQYLVPYLMSSHPGATLDDAIMLAQYLNRVGYMPEQVQDFYPTPGTLSTAMYYTEIDPRTMKPVFVAKTPEDKAMQRALLQWRRPDKRPIVIAALKKAHREDLIGFGRECLIRPGRGSDQRMPGSKQHSVSRHGVSNGGRQQNNDRRHSAPNNGKHSAPNGKRPASRPAQSKPNQGKKSGWAKPKKKK